MCNSVFIATFIGCKRVLRKQNAMKHKTQYIYIFNKFPELTRRVPLEEQELVTRVHPRF